MGIKELQTFTLNLLTNVFYLNQTLYGCEFEKFLLQQCGGHRCKKGPRTSWGWVSILAGRNVLQDEGFWTVVDGSRIKIAKGAWVYKGNNTRMVSVVAEAKVNSLFVSDGGR